MIVAYSVVMIIHFVAWTVVLEYYGPLKCVLTRGALFYLVSLLTYLLLLLATLQDLPGR